MLPVESASELTSPVWKLTNPPNSLTLHYFYLCWAQVVPLWLPLLEPKRHKSPPYSRGWSSKDFKRAVASSSSPLPGPFLLITGLNTHASFNHFSCGLISRTLNPSDTLWQNTIQFSAFLLCLERHGILHQSDKWHLSSVTYRDQGTRSSSLSSETYYQKTNSTSVVRNHRRPSASGRDTRGRGGDCGDLGTGSYTQGCPLVTSRSRVTGSSVGPGLSDLVNFIRTWKSRCLCN